MAKVIEEGNPRGEPEREKFLRRTIMGRTFERIYRDSYIVRKRDKIVEQSFLFDSGEIYGVRRGSETHGNARELHGGEPSQVQPKQ